MVRDTDQDRGCSILVRIVDPLLEVLDCRVVREDVGDVARRVVEVACGGRISALLSDERRLSALAMSIRDPSTMRKKPLSSSLCR